MRFGLFVSHVTENQELKDIRGDPCRKSRYELVCVVSSEQYVVFDRHAQSERRKSPSYVRDTLRERSGL